LRELVAHPKPLSHPNLRPLLEPNATKRPFRRVETIGTPAGGPKNKRVLEPTEAKLVRDVFQ